MSNEKVALISLDGYGIGEPNAGNAIYTAKTPVMDGLLQRWPHTKLSASGLDVGLPDGQMGNSEVGHTNIGSGRVVFQDLPRITNAISDGSFFENPVYGAALDNAANGKVLHILGLLSDGGVHSHIRHIFAMVKMAHDRGIQRVYLHCFLDGRDVAPTSGAGYVRQLHDYCAELGTGKIATLQGRFYGMDRDGGQLCRRCDGRIRQARRLRGGRNDPVRRQRDLHELPSRPRPGNDLCAHAERF